MPKRKEERKKWNFGNAENERKTDDEWLTKETVFEYYKYYIKYYMWVQPSQC